MKPDMWPPNRPDVNLMNYAVCGASSNESITDENLTRWNWTEERDNQWVAKTAQRFIDSSINEWRRRLECVVKKRGGHIELQSCLNLNLINWLITAFIKYHSYV